MKCHKCGGDMVRKGYTHTSRIGGVTVTDGCGLALTCSNCGEVVLSSKDLASYERRAARVALKEAAKVSGEALRYARKALGLRQKDLAAILQRNEQHLSRTEKEPELSMDIRLAMVALLDLADRGEDLNLVGKQRETKLEVRRARVA